VKEATRKSHILEPIGGDSEVYGLPYFLHTSHDHKSLTYDQLRQSRVTLSQYLAFHSFLKHIDKIELSIELHTTGNFAVFSICMTL
jgi:hypothetical protein